MENPKSTRRPLQNRILLESQKRDIISLSERHANIGIMLRMMYKIGYHTSVTVVVRKGAGG